MILAGEAGRRQPRLPGSHPITRVNDRHTYNHAGPTQSFSFSLAVQNPINDMRYSTLSYEIGFVFDNSAQLSAKVSVLSMFKLARL